jgi:hypothetical protein
MWEILRKSYRVAVSFILGYHKSFQIVDYTMANIQKISLSEIVSSVPNATPAQATSFMM